MKNKELIENLERIEAVMIPPCFKADMEAIKGQMLELLDEMTLNTMKRPDIVAVVEIFLAYLRGEERPKGKWHKIKTSCDIGHKFYICSKCNREIDVMDGECLDDYPFCHCGADMREEEQS